MNLFKITLLICLDCSSIIYAQDSQTTLVFDTPANSFTESLPLGNGRLGAIMYGKTTTERIALSEISLWSGGPQDADRENAWQYLKPIQNLLLEGKNKAAQELLQKNFVAKGRGSGFGNGANDKYGCYQTMGDLLIAWKDSLQPVSSYKRWLDLENAIARTSFKRGNITFKEEIFTDFVSDITWVKLSANHPGKINVKLSLYRKENASISVVENDIIMLGQLPAGNEPGMKFATIASPFLKDGQITKTGNDLFIENATECWIKISSATNYNYTNGTLGQEDVLTKAKNHLYSNVNIDFSTALKNSSDAYKQYFNRSRLSFGSTYIENETTLQRLINYNEGAEDNALMALYYNFGRYLLISSSRPGLLPANLQGLWATEYQTPWNGDYHLNINLQMNYWLAETTNLSELAEPLHRFTANLVTNGKKTAKAYYNAEGWVAHVISNPWFYTSPGEGADWGSTLTGGAWLCEHIWEHYRFTQDLDFLSEYYPVLKGSATFLQSILIKDPKNGWLVTAPSNSPEHAYLLADGTAINTTMGPTMDMQIARELFKACIQASELLDIDKSWRNELKNIVPKLAPNQIGKNGDINEWIEDWDDREPKHRHVSHLYGLHPYDEINENDSPNLMEAAKKTLEMRGDGGTG